ncbi:hypothetical protein [Brevibacillus fulvus]|uniref:Uncharacterized protein n=1 Tax=Brevibacillus fulvus TaxID=1125967 RepID=A0A938XY75_9BACL|nr:hypothetical protein [Brevibacillus fulvus]MBM7589094.1 hypothetical protein [Brevibacillus fulvus]
MLNHEIAVQYGKLKGSTHHLVLCGVLKIHAILDRNKQPLINNESVALKSLPLKTTCGQAISLTVNHLHIEWTEAEEYSYCTLTLYVSRDYHSFLNEQEVFVKTQYDMNIQNLSIPRIEIPLRTGESTVPVKVDDFDFEWTIAYEP